MVDTSPERSPRRLPRRDLFVLPLLSFLTLLLMLAGAEVGARVVMPAQDVDGCITHDSRARPMCVSRTKCPECDWVENRYNECGYRSDTACHAPLNGAARMVVVGSSTSWGFDIPYEQTWYSRAVSELSRQCGRRIDVQNLGGTIKLAQIAARVPEAIAQKPDVAVMLMAPFDLWTLPDGDFRPLTLAESEPANPPPPPANHISLLQSLQHQVIQSRAVLAAQHFIFRQPQTYVPLYLRYGDKADFLRTPFTPVWQHRLEYTDKVLGYMADAFHAAGIPFVLVFTPQEAQAEIVWTKQSIPGVSPLALNEAIAEIAHRHGIEFSDVTPHFRDVANASDLFLNVDGHLNGRGNELVAAVVRRTLTQPSAIFGACGKTAQN